MLGRPPVMFDFPTSIPPLEFAPAWQRRKRVSHDFGKVNYLHFEDLLTAKRHANRLQDQADIEELLRHPRSKNQRA